MTSRTSASDRAGSQPCRLGENYNLTNTVNLTRSQSEGYVGDGRAGEGRYRNGRFDRIDQLRNNSDKEPERILGERNGLGAG